MQQLLRDKQAAYHIVGDPPAGMKHLSFSMRDFAARVSGQALQCNISGVVNTPACIPYVPAQRVHLVLLYINMSIVLLQGAHAWLHLVSAVSTQGERTLPRRV